MRQSVVLPAVALLLVACGGAKQPDNIQVVEQYFAYWNDEDVDGIMAMLADEPEIEIDLGSTVSDREQIRANFVELFEQNDFVIEVSDFEVEGDAVSYNYRIFVEGVVREEGRSQAVIADGKIQSERRTGPYQNP